MELETAEIKGNFMQFVLVLLFGPFGLFYQEPNGAGTNIIL
ncbi:hypothetical protein N481_23255 [Pseudoalteromonas luteoviolacea S4047-1]|uniref:Uncharacterized protein n=1 Tax=Pseudoalteromonas luteoviolacea S4054 TaxID=1129367 RepID=A0A0F6AID6_9GAMM|nr:hypothetical protein N479_25515 [Pseudoalteromonas luteoviolacea S4054]KZN68171.1 hypothetical protein N481_23255 [Pseudoalteromonas luteoviolacea S4047-1]